MDAALTQDLIQNLTRILRYSITDLEKRTTICPGFKDYRGLPDDS